MVRYRFSEFTLSPRRRLLVRQGREVPLIPRYFDLLLLLIERRQEAVHRREIFERVWAGVIVSDSALSQAVRSIRRTLGDDPREPRFIRTVSRHGYRFVFPEVIEEEDDGDWPVTTWPAEARGADAAEPREGADPARVDGPYGGDGALWGTTSGVGETPRPGRLAAHEWPAASLGGAVAGFAAGGLGGVILMAAPGSTAPLTLAPVLAVVGAGCGALGGAGVGAGLAVAALAASPAWRAHALVAGGAIGGGLVGAAVQLLTRGALAALVGLEVAVGGGLEGIVIGGAAGLGVAIGTRDGRDGLPAPHGGNRLAAAVIIGLGCGLAGLALTLAGRPLAGGTIHAIADAAEGSRATLAPLGRLLGEPDFGPISSAILAFGEAATFGFGLAWGLLRSPDGSRRGAAAVQ